MFSQYEKLYTLFNRRDKILYSCLFVLMVIGALMEVVGISAVPAFLATLAAPEQVRSYPMAAEVLEFLQIDSARELVLWGAGTMVVVYAFKSAYLVFLAYAQARMTEHQRVRLATELFRRYMAAPYEFHLMRNSAEILRNVNVETKQIISGIINPVLELILAAIMTFAITVLLVVTAPGAALLGVVLVGVGSWVFLRYLKATLTHYGREAKKERKESIQAVNQGIGAFQPTRILGRENYFVDTYHQSIHRFAIYSRFLASIRGSTRPYLEFVAVAGLMVIVFVLAIAGNDMQSMIPMLGLFGAAIVRLRGTVGSIANGVNQVRFNIAAVDAVVDDMRLLEAEENNVNIEDVDHTSSGKREQLHLSREIRLSNVDYFYPEADQPALQDISLTIERGTSVAFVGSTGSGKTTLVNIILGLLTPTKGSVSIDGEDIRSNLRAWQANLGYIPQDIYLLDDTIRRNIAFGVRDEEIDEEKLWNAVRAAQLEEYISQLSGGLDTSVGERGVRLSGGQRQRIGLARALYHDPEVLVMDEATSALDNETERLVMDAVEKLKEERTVIMIAHRLSTVEDCDELFFLKKGRISGTGTYEELRTVHDDFQQMAGVS